MAALLLPAYGSATLVTENGIGVLGPVAIPALVAGAVRVALRVAVLLAAAAVQTPPAVSD